MIVERNTVFGPAYRLELRIDGMEPNRSNIARPFCTVCDCESKFVNIRACCERAQLQIRIQRMSLSGDVYLYTYTHLSLISDLGSELLENLKNGRRGLVVPRETINSPKTC